MRFIVDLPPHIAKRIAEALESGEHASIDEMAVEAFSCVLGSRSRQQAQPSAKAAGAFNGRSSDDRDSTPWLQIPPIATGCTGEVIADSEAGLWIWGMVNRVFPLKLVARVCANLSAREAVPLHTVHQRSAECAHIIGTALAAQDRAKARRRNEGRAVSLPVGHDIQKSKVRFAHQFVGRRGSGRPFVGGAFDTGLLGPVGSGDLIAPTTAGWEFARIRNPVLDESDGVDGGNWNLSPEECDYYLHVVAAQVPAERMAFLAILGSLSRHPMTPEGLARAVAPRTAPGTSTVVADTARAGALGRLIDLRAVVREPKGRSAVFQISSSGQDALKHLSGVE
jgi:Arc/MetJ-type ribon-helix-helix transcriptional regulator